MVAQRRFGPLLLIVFAGLALLLARSFQIQVFERSVWAGQAASLLRSSKVVPYHRGAILDRNGRPLVQDDDAYEVEFCYRDFRRGHPIGAVAHARSVLEMRCVPLAEASARLESYAAEILALSPAAIAAFARGESLATASFVVPPASGANERRSARASDLRFYVGALLRVRPGEHEWMRLKPEDPDFARSYLELFASERGCTQQELLGDVERELAAARTDFAELAELLAQDAAVRAGAGGVAPLEILTEAIEAQRAAAEDATADELFALACGFAPGRISSTSLARVFDLRWIAGVLCWDDVRARAWTLSRRRAHLRDLTELTATRILSQVELVDDPSARGERLLDELAQSVAAVRERRSALDAPPSWRDLDELDVLSELDTLFERPAARARVDLSQVALLDPEFAGAARELDDPWLAVGLVAELAGAAAIDARSAGDARDSAERWRKLAQEPRGMESAEARRELVALLVALDEQLARAADRVLAQLCPPLGDGAPATLAIAEGRLTRALQQQDYVLREEQNRRVAISRAPSYALVHRLERYPERHRGFEVRETTRRAATAFDRDGAPLATHLIGRVRRPSLTDLFAQVRDEKRLASLQYKEIRTRADEDEIRALAARLFRSDENFGDRGVEAYFDAELRGRYGYRETENRRRSGAPASALFQSPVDGQDIVLSIDAELQRAAQETLAHPELPPDPQTDRMWFLHPVGAIVLLAPDGEVLAAASVPTRGGEPPTPGRGVERTHSRERTLSRPTFTPPGSVFKPFVAAFALDRLGFDPETRYACVPIDDGGPGYVDLHCHSLHVECDLERALEVSCNSFFAHLGETYPPEKLLEMAHVFGFGEPTGIRHMGTSGRSGLREDWRFHAETRLLAELGDASRRRRFANGLAIMEATPMQVARATAGLLTGELPEVRIVRSIGGVPVAAASRPLGLSQASLAFVRRAMEGVVEDMGGSAYGKGLDRGTLGFRVAAKTGSGDYAAFVAGPEQTPDDRADMEAGKVRKHTWLAGWFPADAPKAVVVVFLHDVSKTASHTAVYVAGQFLKSDAVRRFVAGKPSANSSAPTTDAPRATTEEEAR